MSKLAVIAMLALVGAVGTARAAERQQTAIRSLVTIGQPTTAAPAISDQASSGNLTSYLHKIGPINAGSGRQGISNQASAGNLTSYLPMTAPGGRLPLATKASIFDRWGNE